MFTHQTPSGYKGLSGFHKYWGKKPIEAWQFLIQNFTDRHDIVVDPFVGSGLIAKESVDLSRRFIGFDINPISIELTNLYLQLPSYKVLSESLDQISIELKDDINSMYRLPDQRVVSHLLWRDNRIIGAWTKERNKRHEIDLLDNDLKSFQNGYTYSPKHIGQIRLFDNSRINSRKNFDLSDLFSMRAIRAIDLLRSEIDKYEGCVRRALLLILTSSLGQMSDMVFAVTKRGKTTGSTRDTIEVGSWVIGYWKPNQHFEVNAWNCFENKANKLLKAIRGIGESKDVAVAKDVDDFFQDGRESVLEVGDSEQLLDRVPANCAKVILTDPPHGDRIPYLELSEMWNSVIGLESNYEDELVVSDAKLRNKSTDLYNRKLSTIFTKCERILRSDGLMAVIFNARVKDHWKSLDEIDKSTSLQFIGCYPIAYSSGSVVQDNRKGGLKSDYVLLFTKGKRQIDLNSHLSILENVDGWSEDFPLRS